MLLDRLIWRYYKYKSYWGAVIQYKVLHRPIKWSRWGGKKHILGTEECSKMIEKALAGNIPFAAARFGSVEMNAVLTVLQERLWGKREEDLYNEMKSSLRCNAGMFSNDEEGIEKFVDCYLQAAQKIDLLGIWFSEQEEYLIRKFMMRARVTPLKNLEPYYNESAPWSRALTGKKVLVVHPFAETIEKQYKKRSQLWKNGDFLPDFELITFKAVQTIAGQKDERFTDWMAALEYMEKEISMLEFDVALIGCGAYGLPLAVRIKDMGKQAVHLGGATQILFGIKGKRWEEMEFFRNFMNEYWVRPDALEKPLNSDQVEEGCYW